MYNNNTPPPFYNPNANPNNGYNNLQYNPNAPPPMTGSVPQTTSQTFNSPPIPTQFQPSQPSSAPTPPPTTLYQPNLNGNVPYGAPFQPMQNPTTNTVTPPLPMNPMMPQPPSAPKELLPPPTTSEFIPTSSHSEDDGPSGASYMTANYGFGGSGTNKQIAQQYQISQHTSTSTETSSSNYDFESSAPPQVQQKPVGLPQQPVQAPVSTAQGTVPLSYGQPQASAATTFAPPVTTYPNLVQQQQQPAPNAMYGMATYSPMTPQQPQQVQQNLQQAQQPYYGQQAQQPSVNDLTSQMANMALTASGVKTLSNVNTQHPDNLPRPYLESLGTEDVPQPETTTLFSRMNQRQRVDFSKANCSSRYMRATTQCVPNVPALLNKWPLPFGVLCTPFAEGEELPVVNLGKAGVIRCTSCRTYINPFCVFIDGGRRFQCNMCKKLNDVPNEYFSPLDEFGCRQDIANRLELQHGSIEFVASQEYMARPPQPPAYMFLIDVSYPAVAAGMPKIVARAIKKSLDKISGDVRTRVGFLCFDSSLYFFNLKSTLTQPQMLCVGELVDSLLPIPTDLLVNLEECRSQVDILLDKLENKLFQNTKNGECALASALNAAGRLLGRIGGKICLFSANLPTVGPHTLPNRDDRSIYGTDNEKLGLFPKIPNYKELALLYSRDQICCDMFVASDQFVDLATTSNLAKFSGGSVHYYPNFRPETDGEKLKYDIYRVLTRETGLEAVMRVRASSGLKTGALYGHFFIKGSDLVSLPNVDTDKCFAAEVQFDGNGLMTANACVQCAVLYTTTNGERRIRVHTLTLPIVGDLDTMYRHSDVDATVTFLSKVIANDLPKNGFVNSRNKVRDTVVNALNIYRAGVSPNQIGYASNLVIPESLRLLPLYAIGLMKSDLLVGEEGIRLDQRSHVICKFSTGTVSELLPFIHPVLLCVPEEELPEVDSDEFALPAMLPASQKSMSNDKIFLVTDGTQVFVWPGFNLMSNNTELQHDIFDVLNQLNSPLTKEIAASLGKSTLTKNFVKLVIALRKRFGYMNVKMCSGTAIQRQYLKRLIEDKFSQQNYAYDEFISFLHSSLLNRK